MRNILSIFLTLLAMEGFGQAWVDYKVDESVTVSVPDNFQAKDTLGQIFVSARIDNALIVIQKVPNEGETIIQLEHNLIEAYERFQKEVISSQNGRFRSKRWPKRNGVHLMEFSYNVGQGEERQVRHCLAFFLNNYWYAIQFWEVASMTDQLEPEREKLFASLKFPESVSVKNQINAAPKTSPYFVPTMIVAAHLMAGVVVGVSQLILRKARRKKSSGGA